MFFSKKLKKFDNIKHCFFSRKNGFSKGHYSSLNCGLGSSETITVQLTNFGNFPQSSFPISYVLNNGAPVTETYTGTINPQDTLTYVFSTIQDLSVKGRYVFDAYTSLVTDTMAANDGVDATLSATRSKRGLSVS